MGFGALFAASGARALLAVSRTAAQRAPDWRQKNSAKAHCGEMGQYQGLLLLSDGDGRGKFSTVALQLQKASEISSGAALFRALPN